MNEHELQDAVNRLPKSIEPPRDLWPGIEARLARSGGGAWRRRWYWVPLALAAVLVFLLIARAERSAWDVTALAGRPLQRFRLQSHPQKPFSFPECLK